MASKLPPVTSYHVPKIVQRELEELKLGTGLSVSFLAAEAIRLGLPQVKQRHPILDEPTQAASGHKKKVTA